MKVFNFIKKIIIILCCSLGTLAYANYLTEEKRGPIRFLFIEIPHEYPLAILLVLNVLFVVDIFTKRVDKIMRKAMIYLFSLFGTAFLYSICMSIFLTVIVNKNLQTSIFGLLTILGMNMILSGIFLAIYYCIKEDNKKKKFENHLAFVHYILIYCSTLLSGLSLLSQEVSTVWNPYIILLVLAVLNNYVCKAVITKTLWA
ncbi:hypothetical protein [Bacillus sp. RC252]|uniref:hypothetical protein n=1 Tax=Bacillus sp. RC252 TaxID=3156289 RepID=UPI003835E705